MPHIMERIAQLLESGERLALATILHQDGSTPRTAGARMFVTADGRSEGTIGGGLAEAMAQRLGQELLAGKDGAHAELLDVDMSSSKPSDMDMICGGSLETYVEVLEPEPEIVAVFTACADAIRQGRTALFATRLPGGKARPTHCVLDPAAPEQDGTCDGRLPDQADASTILDASRNGTWIVTAPAADGARWFVETLSPPDTVYLFGAGHVAQATAVVAAQADFRVAVLDDRPEFANRERYPDAHRIIVLDSFEGIFQSPELARDRIAENSYLVIVTRGHSHDGLVLRQALATGAGYVGMIGSSSKRETIYQAMREDGYTDADLARVHSPIGLSIGAQTPGEIAVSIVAELVQHRRQGDQGA